LSFSDVDAAAEKYFRRRFGNWSLTTLKKMARKSVLLIAEHQNFLKDTRPQGLWCVGTKPKEGYWAKIVVLEGELLYRMLGARS